MAESVTTQPQSNSYPNRSTFGTQQKETKKPSFFVTPKLKTPLPLLELKGKDYLQVAHRLVWFREDHPDWTIKTELVKLEGMAALFKAEVLNPEGKVIATAHKTENQKGFGDYIEKAETGAVGRALALCGYGTQFAPEFDEGERLADSPVTRPQQS